MTHRRNGKGTIVIVGAGAAGLQAALTLETKYGYENYVILEARDRVGGRICTWRQEVKPGHHPGVARMPECIDLGAAWVHGTEPHSFPNPMMEYLEPSDLQPIVPGNPWMRPWTVMHLGRRGDMEKGRTGSPESSDERLLYLYHEGERLDENENVVEKALLRHFELLQGRVPEKVCELYNAGRGLETEHQSLQETLDSILREFPVSRDGRIDALTNFYLHLISVWYGKSSAELQLSNFAADEADETRSDVTDREDFPKAPPDWDYREVGDFPGPHCLVKGGMDRITRSMLEKLGNERILLQQEVVEIWQEAGQGITVRTKSGTFFQGDACIVTLPINCLRQDVDRIFSKTQLSNAKREAMQRVSMGKYKKVMLVFDRIFWPVSPPFLGLLRPTDSSDCRKGTKLGTCLLLDNLWARDKQGTACLEAILVGEAADWATGRPDEEIRDEVLAFLQQAMGLGRDVFRWCVDCHVTRWEEDPYSRGAYSSWSLGGLPRHVDAIQQPEWDGALMFAGDAVVDDLEGSVAAALLSGRNAAEKIHSFLSRVCSRTGTASRSA